MNDLSRKATVSLVRMYLFVAALILVPAWSLRFWQCRASTVRVEPSRQVVSFGPYALVRHPMHAGCVLMFVAIPLALGSFWGFVPAALLCAVLVFRLLDEEQHLASNLPGYAAYHGRVRWRLVPWLW